MGKSAQARDCLQRMGEGTFSNCDALQKLAWLAWLAGHDFFVFFFNVDERIANVYPKPFPSCLGPLLICAQHIGQRMLIDRKPRTCFPLRMGMQAHA